MEIINGRNTVCKDSQGGVSNVWLFKYVKYNRSQIVIQNSELISFPESDIYEFEFIGDTGFNENIVEEDGGKYYQISFDIQIDGYTNPKKFLDFDYRAVALDRLGNFRLLGVYNGLTSPSVNKTTGSSKSDFNGLKLTFEGRELIESPYFYDIEVITGVQIGYLLQENGDYLLQENGFKIIL